MKSILTTYYVYGILYIIYERSTKRFYNVLGHSLTYPKESIYEDVSLGPGPWPGPMRRNLPLKIQQKRIRISMPERYLCLSLFKLLKKK